MASDAYVFISYSRRDEALVSRLSDDLRAAGIRIWRDVEKISPGENWEKEIEKGLVGANAFLYVSSANSIQSGWMAQELAGFMARQQKVIPIILDDVGADRMPLPLKAIQWVDFRGDYNDGLQLLLRALPEFLQQDKPVHSPSIKSKGYVFLSYAEEDVEFVSGLKEFLKKHNYAYWDYSESDRDYHSQLSLELEGVIGNAAATLSVLSPAWKQSNWALKEYFFSEEARVPVFLLRARPMGPTLAIAGVPYIDFTADRQRGLDKLNRELKRKGL